MKIIQVVGWSGSGKTTLIVDLIGRFRARGFKIGALKHTHHPLEADERGDTARFRLAGANPVILAGDGDALLGGIRQTFDSTEQLLGYLHGVELVFVEGFKQRALGTRIELESGKWVDAATIERELDTLWRSS
ncbi:MAG: molybdopterin-guanine dinucleotide biosynthesis protein B [Acidobacteriota bacterium]